jgi:WD40 repeat protein
MKPMQTFTGHESTIMSLTSCESSINLFVSGSLDGTVRLWDIRNKTAVSKITGKTQTKQTYHQQPAMAPDGDTSFDFLQHEENKTDDSHHNGACNDGQENQQSTGRALGTLQHNQLDRIRQSNSGSTGVPVGVVRLDPSGRLLVSGHHDGSCMLYDIRANQVIQLFQAHESEIRTLSFSPNAYYLLTGSYDRKVKLTDLQGRLTQPLPGVEVAELDDKVVQVAWHPQEYNFVTTCADGSATLWTIPDFDDWRDSIVMDTSLMI